MAARVAVSLPCRDLLPPRPAAHPHRRFVSPAPSSSSTAAGSLALPPQRFRSSRRRPFSVAAAAAAPLNTSLVRDLGAAVVTSAAALALLRFWEELAKRDVFEQKLNRKLVHISLGLVFMLSWPIFSSGRLAPFLAALAAAINSIRMLLLGLGIWKNDAMIKSITRYGDYRELLKGPLYYTCTITFSTSIFWRTSPIAIAAICNLCAGDGLADIVGRRFGRKKLPYNPSKSFAGSIAMVLAGFLSSIGIFKEYEEHDFARTGCIATEKVELKEDPLEQFTHEMEPYLRKQGVPVRLNKGVIELVSDFVVCEERMPLSPESALTLRLLGIKMATFRLHLVCRWTPEDFEVYKEDLAHSDVESS